MGWSNHPILPGPKINLKKVLTNQNKYDIILIESEVMIMNEPFPYIACPDCESQLLNPTIEDGMYHFVCHECGSGVWLEIEESEE